VRGSPWAHLGITPALLCGTRRGERRRPMLTRQNRKGNIESSSPSSAPPRLRVNRTSASDDIKTLTLRLARAVTPCSSCFARSIDSHYASPLWAPGQRGQNDSELGSPTSHPRVSPSLSPTSLAVCYQPRPSALLSPLNRTLRFHYSLPPVPVVLSLLPLLFPLPAFHLRVFLARRKGCFEASDCGRLGRQAAGHP
jgi:hypothetical protein